MTEATCIYLIKDQLLIEMARSKLLLMLLLKSNGDDEILTALLSTLLYHQALLLFRRVGYYNLRQQLSPDIPLNRMENYTYFEFQRRFRVNKEAFIIILKGIHPLIQVKWKRGKIPIPTWVMLACTLRYKAFYNYYHLSFRYLAGGSYLDIVDFLVELSISFTSK